jgi:hypothetical protein
MREEVRQHRRGVPMKTSIRMGESFTKVRWMRNVPNSSDVREQ